MKHNKKDHRESVSVCGRFKLNECYYWLYSGKGFMKLSLNLREGFVKRSKIKDKLIREKLETNNGILHQGPDPTHPHPLMEKITKNKLS